MSHDSNVESVAVPLFLYIEKVLFLVNGIYYTKGFILLKF